MDDAGERAIRLAGDGLPAAAGPDVPAPVVQGWADAGVAPLRDKVSIGIRLDRDLVAWFKEQGPGYQTRINAVLRQFMDARKSASWERP